MCLMSINHCHPFLGETESKHEERPLSKADKETKRKGNSFKKDPMTQTRLSNFFQKASSKTPRSSPDESAEDNTYERDVNADDTTLKLEETESSDNQQRNIHEDTTLKLDELEQSNNDDKEVTRDNITKTFVINITLKGVPSNSEGFDDSKNNNTKRENNKRPHNDNVSKVKGSPSPKKVKPTAKRKIKALFGDSSGSDSESKDDKRVKLEPEFLKRAKEQQCNSKSSKIERDNKSKIEKHKSKSTKPDHCESNLNNIASEQGKRVKNEASETKSPRKELKRANEGYRDSKKYERDHEIKSKSTESKHSRPKKKDDKKSHKRTPEKHKTENASKSKDVTSIFGDLCGSDSEKELIIDEGLESLTNNEEETQDNQPTNTKDTEIFETGSYSGTDPINTLEDNLPQQINNSEEFNSSVRELDDNKLDKAHKLSIEADKVLQELKQFSEMPPEPDIVQEKKLEQKVKPLEVSHVSRSTSKHKSQESKRHKISLSSKTKDKHSVKERKDKRPNKIEDRKEKHLKFDEHVNEKKQDKEDPSKKSEKVDVASLVVKLLMPYYKKKKISSRDLFKITARHIVHQLLAIQVTGKI